MSDNETPDDGQSEDEKLASEWEAAMEESGDTEDNVEDEWAAAMAEAESIEGGEAEDIQSAPLEAFEPSPSQAPGNMAPDLDVILDIPVTISMEVGNTSIPIRNLLQLNQGSVIELDRLAGEPFLVSSLGALALGASKAAS